MGPLLSVYSVSISNYCISVTRLTADDVLIRLALLLSTLLLINVMRVVKWCNLRISG
jgi:hypothetical protein